MSRIRKKVVERLVQESLSGINDSGLSKEEIIVFLSEILTRIGYSLYYRYERPDIERPKGKLEGPEIERLWLEDSTAGSSLMKLGFDVHDVLLRRPRKRNKDE